MPNTAGEPEPTEGPLESSGSEESDHVENRSLSKEEEPAAQASASGEAAAETQDWWSAEPASDWAQPAGSASDTEPAIPKEATTADVYFCGHTTLLSLSRALQAIAKEKLTGALRAFWDRESIELLAQDGAIVFATTRDHDLYCPDAPAVLANVDAEIVAKARAQQSETGVPFFVTLTRGAAMADQPLLERVLRYWHSVSPRF